MFLAFVVVAYLLAYMYNQEQTSQALALFGRVMQQVFPVLGIVFLLLLVSNMMLTPGRVRHYLGEEAGIKGWVASVVGGIFSMGPVYAWYAVLSELRAKGMRTALTAVFLYSRAIKLPLLPLMIYYFGLPYTLILCLYLVAFAVINGILVERLVAKHH
ncbi:MAG: permease [Gammaproteobacteria bacterium]